MTVAGVAGIDYSVGDELWQQHNDKVTNLPVANIIFLESPIGVGFSYTNNSNDLNELGDGVSASDNYDFLMGWFKRFPSFRSNEFYVVGESYGGHYAPQLAELIYEGNKRGPYINIKGFMMGNAVINDITDLKGVFDFAVSHAIISTQVYDGIRNCDFSEKKLKKNCDLSLARFLKAFSDIDIFSIYSPICPDERTQLVVAPRVVTKHELRNGVWSSGYNPCDDRIEKYFNNKDVQRAIHENTTNLPYPYTLCSSLIRGWNDSPITVLPLIQKLLRVGLRIWMYRGVEEYEGGLTFASVRGAGHQVPLFAPQQALSLFTHFLSSQPLPSSRF
ncbi:unnamed protein product [Sphenostylis stenocarpa]|uniref:Carboxypeptidase n=1 Tax=Sphenostylis stenocarpa TaxID=92480 RepID=A0AA86S5L0_9FABA|nr:unnamed protein product [Sphenostylis stenocarpa]